MCAENTAGPIRWPQGMYGTPVSMREDRVTAIDVEVVAQFIAGEALAKTHLSWDTLDDTGRDLWRHNAAQLLTRVFSVPFPPLFEFRTAHDSAHGGPDAAA